MCAFDLLGNSDPFVEVMYNNSVSTSSVINNTLNPDWSADPPHIFPFLAEKILLQLKIFDKDMKSKEVMGCIDINLESALKDANPIERKPNCYTIRKIFLKFCDIIYFIYMSICICIYK